MMSPLAKTVLTNAAIGVGAGVAIGASAAAIEDEDASTTVAMLGGIAAGTAITAYPIGKAYDHAPMFAPTGDLVRFAGKAQLAGIGAFTAAITGTYLGVEALRGD